MRSVLALLSSLSLAAGYAFVAGESGIKNTHLLNRQQNGGANPGGPLTCPFNPNHIDAPLVTDRFPYNSARNGQPGKGIGGYIVPAPGDDAHQFIAPTSNDIRGPCPGLNTAANHGFIARDGITNYAEMVDAVQNVYNMGYDLANFLATISIFFADGDLLTTKLSIGCDATTRTSFNPALTGSQPGLSGHNKFEADSSLTRNDFFTGGGDNFKFNGTLFGNMATTTYGNFDLNGLAYYRFLRYHEARNANPNFFFGPLAIFTHGAASFVYELFPSGTESYSPNLANTASFFGAKQESDGTWSHVPERIPPNWTTRGTPYNFMDVAYQTFQMYALYPVGFGGNAGPNNFIGIDFPPFIKNGTFTGTKPEDAACLLYQFVFGPIPSSLNAIVTPTVEALSFALSKLGGNQYKNLGCPMPLT